MILDATCAARQIWNNKRHRDAVYVDRRILPRGSKPSRPNWNVEPVLAADFCALPFRDETFSLVVWDPPHIVRLKPSPNSILRINYGELNGNWADVLRQGYAECMRVLKRGGSLVFKWSEVDISTEDCFRLFRTLPLWRSSGTFHLFYKPETGDAETELPLFVPQTGPMEIRELPNTDAAQENSIRGGR